MYSISITSACHGTVQYMYVLVFCVVLILTKCLISSFRFIDDLQTEVTDMEISFISDFCAFVLHAQCCSNGTCTIVYNHANDSCSVYHHWIAALPCAYMDWLRFLRILLQAYLQYIYMCMYNVMFWCKVTYMYKLSLIIPELF